MRELNYLTPIFASVLFYKTVYRVQDDVHESTNVMGMRGNICVKGTCCVRAPRRQDNKMEGHEEMDHGGIWGYIRSLHRSRKGKEIL